MAQSKAQRIKDIVSSRYVEHIYPSSKALESALKKGKKLSLYIGIDPTSPDLHIGHAVSLLLLRQFQALGHKVIFLVGDFTAQIGDPTDKAAARKLLTHKEVLQNAKHYVKQVSPLLNFTTSRNPAAVQFNSTWLKKLTLADTIRLMATTTVGQIIKRDMFKERMKVGKEIYLHEFIYPLLQGYDSVAMNVDIEIGGNDQTFNMLAGRDLAKQINKKEKFVIAVKLLADPKTGKKMSKSEGSYVALSASAKDMYGQMMALSDEMIVPALELCTEVSAVAIAEIKKAVKKGGLAVRDAKQQLATEVVRMYHGAAKASAAQKEFDRVFQKKSLPGIVQTARAAKKATGLTDLLVIVKLADSKAEAKRLVIQGGVKIDGIVHKKWQHTLVPQKGQIIQVGKRRFIKII